ncbi:transposase [Xenorhabdus beddingii]|uniref:Transposase n=1 Tax=Xenorhabdus beddingii TaxID=40578 RepID=A0A1Y2SR81_9GAMM|nr:transposase [Xenorhabdus beddingii]OTA20226.1 transposase [Xenorhabdus beddingii]
MTRYPAEFKRAIQEKMLPPHNVSVSSLSKTLGIPTSTLSDWRKNALAAKKNHSPGKTQHQKKTPPQKTGQDLLQATIKVTIKI